MPIKLGRIPYLNSEVFYQNTPLDLLEVCTHVPAALSHAARRGDIDLAPLPIVTCFELEDDFEPLGSFGIAVEGLVRSIILFAKRPIEELGGHPVALTGESTTSVRLLKILFNKRYGVAPSRYVSTQDPNEALLLIGDAALKNRKGLPSYPHQYDIGELWHEWTGLPFVFARWVIRRDIDPGTNEFLTNMLSKSIDIGLGRLDEIAKIRADLGMTDSEVREYLEAFHYRLGEREIEAIEKFRSLLKELELV